MNEPAYKCPVCESKLMPTTKFNRDFFCKSCHTAVMIINDDCFMLPRGSMFNERCHLEEIRT